MVGFITMRPLGSMYCKWFHWKVTASKITQRTTEPVLQTRMQEAVTKDRIHLNPYHFKRLPSSARERGLFGVKNL